MICGVIPVSKTQASSKHEQNIRGASGYERISPDAQSFWSVFCHGLHFSRRIFLQNMSMFQNVYALPVLTRFDIQIIQYL